MKKQIETVSAEIMNALVNWTWPGNVRELSPQDSFNDGSWKACGARPLFACCEKPAEC